LLSIYLGLQNNVYKYKSICIYLAEVFAFFISIKISTYIPDKDCLEFNLTEYFNSTYELPNKRFVVSERIATLSNNEMRRDRLVRSIMNPSLQKGIN